MSSTREACPIIRYPRVQIHTCLSYTFLCKNVSGFSICCISILDMLIIFCYFILAFNICSTFEFDI